MSKSVRVLNVLVAAVPFFAAPALAQTRAGQEFLVAGYASLPTLPAVAMLRDGGFVVAFQGVDGSGEGIVGRVYAPDGASVSGLQVNEHTTGAQLRPRVAALAGGGYVVAWSGVGPGDADEGVFAKRFSVSGLPTGSEFQVNANTAGLQRLPAVAAGPPGFAIVWEGPDDGSGPGVFGRRFDASGAPIGAEFLVNTYTTAAQYAPSVAVAADGRFVVVWTSVGQDGEGEGVFGQRYDAAGARAGAEFMLNTSTTGDQAEPSVGCDAAGNHVVAWRGPDGDFQGVMAQRFDSNGDRLGSEFLVFESTAGQTDTPQVAFDEAGDFVVAFRYLPPILGPRPLVVARRFDRTGQPREGSFFAAAPNPNIGNTFPAVSADPVGNFVVAWVRQAGFGEVYAQRFGVLPAAAMVVDRSPSGVSNGNQVFESGEAVFVEVAWFNYNGQAQTFSGTGTSFAGPGAPDNPAYLVLDATASYGTVANGGASSCASLGDCYVLAITTPSARPAQHWDATLVEDILPASLGMAKSWSLHVGGSFADVAGDSPYYRFIETLLHKSVTAGCAAGSYCPATSTTREQMAVFVLVAKEGAGFLPPACTVPVFNDVPASSPFCRWIEELARRGVVAGCGGGAYCASASVTREQMSVFVLKTLDPALDPLACTTPVFADVPASSPFCRWIEELVRRGVVSGCGGGRYCPADAVTREQMAVFLGVTFNLALYGP